jgi:hypothetical protein
LFVPFHLLLLATLGGSVAVAGTNDPRSRIGHVTLRNVLAEVPVNDTACPLCHASRLAAERLPRTRLGVHERALLLHAGPVDAPAPLFALPSAQRRSLVTLRRKGLVIVRDHHARRGMDSEAAAIHGKRWMRPRTLVLTPFGQELVRLYRRELETGVRLRWDHRVGAALDPAVAACDHALG